MNRKISIILRIITAVFLVVGLVFLGKSISVGHDSRILGYALVMINFANLFNIIASRKEVEDKSSKPSKVLKVCAIVLAVSLVAMFIALLLG